MVQNGIALTINDDGTVLACETYRFANGVEDNRQHTDWILDDLAVTTLAERRLMLNNPFKNSRPRGRLGGGTLSYGRVPGLKKVSGGGAIPCSFSRRRQSSILVPRLCWTSGS